MTTADLGEVVTFYSYKGGTGRTMALANVACLLAQRARRADGERVLMIDWDLEAPGLHLYFKDLCTSWSGRGGTPRSLDEAPGLIDLFERLDADVRSAPRSARDGSLDPAPEIVRNLDLAPYVVDTDIPSLDLLKAGSFRGDYSRRVNRFQWEELFLRSPALIRTLAERLADEYRYVLVDSRTGLTDTSGICTVLMPEKLVVVFTPNQQSLTGVMDLVRRATRFRRDSDDLRPLLVYPMPSRIEQARPMLRDGWRSGERGSALGYQPQFERLFQETYGLPHCSLQRYFDEVQIQHVPDYAYGEVIAVRVEQSRDRLSLSVGYENFVRWLVERAGPWDEQDEQDERKEPGGAAPPNHAAALAKTAQAAFDSCSPAEQALARRTFLDLVWMAPSPQLGAYTSRKVTEASLQPDAVKVTDRFVAAGVLAASGSPGERIFELAADSLLHTWPLLRRWIEEDRDFLLWRQRLGEKRAEWETGGRRRGDLLPTDQLLDARDRLERRGDDLSEADRAFIHASSRRQRLWELVVAAAAGLVVLLLLLLYHQSCTG